MAIVGCPWAGSPQVRETRWRRPVPSAPTFLGCLETQSQTPGLRAGLDSGLTHCLGSPAGPQAGDSVLQLCLEATLGSAGTAARWAEPWERAPGLKLQRARRRPEWALDGRRREGCEQGCQGS